MPPDLPDVARLRDRLINRVRFGLAVEIILGQIAPRTLNFLVQLRLHYGLANFTAGGIYRGEWRDSKHDGYGEMSYADGSVYKGHWVAGDRVWDSDLRLADGTVYQRDGVITLPSGECYEGDWHDEMRSGKGRQVYADRRIYDGDWKDDKHHGFGMELFQELDEDNNAAVIVFDHEANTVIPLGIVDDAFRTNAETIFSGYGPAGGTDIEGALRLAESLCDPARKSMVILLSDGLSSVDAKSITTNANHE